MDRNDEIKRQLLARERDLETSLNRLDSQVRSSAEIDVEDEMDQVITAEAKGAALDISTREFQALRDVRDALKRLDTGSYGQCVVCGNTIESLRLSAIPETPFCRQHADTPRAAAASAGALPV